MLIGVADTTHEVVKSAVVEIIIWKNTFYAPDLKFTIQLGSKSEGPADVEQNLPVSPSLLYFPDEAAGQLAQSSDAQQLSAKPDVQQFAFEVSLWGQQ